MWWSEAELIADAEAGPQGPFVGAFFDFDGTLIDGYSVAAFARYHLGSGQVAPADLGQMLVCGLGGVTTEQDFERLTTVGLRTWAGRSESDLAALGERLFAQVIIGSLYPQGRRLVEAHHRAGHAVVVASAGTRFQVEPAAKALGVTHILVSQVETVNGICTGRPVGPLLWREAKAAAVRSFARDHAINLERSYAYSDGYEDLPLLQAVGRPRVLNPSHDLEVAARDHGWPAGRFRARRPSIPHLVAAAAGHGLRLPDIHPNRGSSERRRAMGKTTDIREAVEEELAGDRLIDAAAITVRNFNGDVTLQGNVPSYPQYLEATEAAWRIPGVTSVRNHLEVVLPPENYRADAMLTTAANNALAASATAPEEVEAIARDGNLTLTGMVKYPRQRAAAEATVSGLTGVRNVKDEIQIVFDVDPADVNQLVRKALDRHQVAPDNSHVAANITGNTVVLVGNVRTRAQRDAVVGAAWLGHGVMVVIDELQITG